MSISDNSDDQNSQAVSTASPVAPAPVEEPAILDDTEATTDGISFTG